MAIKNSSTRISDYELQRCVSVAQKLENEGKITREACIAILKGDEDTYSEEMLNAAYGSIYGNPPHFLSKQETKALVDQYQGQSQSQQVEPVERDDTGEKLFCMGAKWLFLHATGLAIPYAFYKIGDAIDNNKKTLGGATAIIGLAAFIGLDAD